jgi:hypothetical protein
MAIEEAKKAGGQSAASPASASFLKALFAKPFDLPRESSPQPGPAVAGEPAPLAAPPQALPRAANLHPAPEQESPAPNPLQRGPLEPSPAEAKPAEAPPSAEPVVASSPAKGRDRRVQSRQAVDTTAFVNLVKIASRLSGRILDLSLSGCRIRTDERFPVGIYTRVETEFQLEGLPFRLGGVVQAVHDRHHVGIRFLDMSERKQQQIEQLIEEIKEMHGETHSEKHWTEKGEDQ